MRLASIGIHESVPGATEYVLEFDNGRRKRFIYGGVIQKTHGNQALGYEVAKSIIEAFRDEAFDAGGMEAVMKIRGDHPDVIEAVKRAKELLK